MGNSSKNQPTVAIEKWLSEGRKIHKRHRFTFFFGSLLGTIICTPLSILFVALVVPRSVDLFGPDQMEAMDVPYPWFLAPILAFTFIPLLMVCFGPLYAGICHMGLKSMRGEKPRLRDVFKGFNRFWGTCFLWLIFPTGIFIRTYANTILIAGDFNCCRKNSLNIPCLT